MTEQSIASVIADILVIAQKDACTQAEQMSGRDLTDRYICSFRDDLRNDDGKKMRAIYHAARWLERRPGVYRP